MKQLTCLFFGLFLASCASETENVKETWIGQCVSLEDGSEFPDDTFIDPPIDLAKLPRKIEQAGDTLLCKATGRVKFKAQYRLEYYLSHSELRVNESSTGDSTMVEAKKIVVTYEPGSYKEGKFDIEVLSDGVYCSVDGRRANVCALVDYKTSYYQRGKEFTRRFDVNSDFTIEGSAVSLHFDNGTHEYQVSKDDCSCVLYQVRPKNNQIEMKRL